MRDVCMIRLGIYLDMSDESNYAIRFGRDSRYSSDRARDSAREECLVRPRLRLLTSLLASFRLEGLSSLENRSL